LVEEQGAQRSNNSRGQGPGEESQDDRSSLLPRIIQDAYDVTREEFTRLLYRASSSMIVGHHGARRLLIVNFEYLMVTYGTY
jgi:hypothetical protein